VNPSRRSPTPAKSPARPTGRGDDRGDTSNDPTPSVATREEHPMFEPMMYELARQRRADLLRAARRDHLRGAHVVTETRGRRTVSSSGRDRHRLF
jgi:hypothetical protein